MEDQIWNNIIKRLTDVETEESRLSLDQWLNKSAENIKLYHEAEQLWQLTALLPKKELAPKESVLTLSAVAQKKSKSFNGVIKYGIAASLVILASFATYHLTKSRSQLAKTEIVYTVRKAANGKVIQITLADSSVIWLNSGSQVSYPKDFLAQKTRNIKLVGEAFFDVAHNEKQPFVVESGNLKTVVYGTSFNVSSYKNSRQSSVTVKSGKVGVLLINDSLNKPTMLLAGNRLVYHLDNGKLEKRNIYEDEVAPWLNGDLIFDEATPQEVFAALSRKFNVDFSFNEAGFEGCKLTAKFPNQNLKSILTALSTSLHIKVNEHGKTIKIIGGQPCR